MSVADVLNSYRETLKKKKKESKADIGLGTEMQDLSLDPKDYIPMPHWWKVFTGVPGLPFGLTVIGGDSDTGKTTACLEAIKSGQEQLGDDLICIYAETEFKTKRASLANKNIDLENVIFVQSGVVEDLFTEVLGIMDTIIEKAPDKKILIIIDSVGNLLTKKDDEDLDLEKSDSPGGKGKQMRRVMSALLAKAAKHEKTSVLAVTYVYDNVGSPGVTFAGGKILKLRSTFRLLTKRKSWIDKVEKGVKKRAGIVAVFAHDKNHVVQALRDEDGNPINPPTKIELKITEKVELVGSNKED